MKILKARGMEDEGGVAEFTTGSLPKDWPWAVFCGLEELLNLLEGREIDIWGLPEGTIFTARDVKGRRVPVLTVEGPYSQYCIYETPALGFICHSSGVATMAARCRKAAGDRDLISFGIRRMNPFLAPSIDRAAYIGGCDGVSSLAGADAIGKDPIGTMPHALMIIHGDEAEAFRAFDEVIEPNVPRVALIDTYSDEKFGAVIACEAVDDLSAVRLDTPGSRKGSFEELIQEVRWEMDVRGFEDVDIIVSGGLDEYKLMRMRGSPVQGYGVGTSISNAPTVNFAMDIIEKDGKPVAKRGKLGAKKEVYRCSSCLQIEVVSREAEPPECTDCSSEMVLVQEKLMENGRKLTESPSPEEIRERVLAQLSRVELELQNI